MTTKVNLSRKCLHVNPLTITVKVVGPLVHWQIKEAKGMLAQRDRYWRYAPGRGPLAGLIDALEWVLRTDRPYEILISVDQNLAQALSQSHPLADQTRRFITRVGAQLDYPASSAA